MKNIIYGFMFIFSIKLYALDLHPIYSDKELKNKIELYDVDSVSVSKIDLCLKKECIAYQVSVKENFIFEKSNWDNLGGTNPASFLCTKIAGTPKIYYRENLNEVSVCFFNDKSFILTWDLYKKILAKNSKIK